LLIDTGRQGLSERWSTSALAAKTLLATSGIVAD